MRRAPPLRVDKRAVRQAPPADGKLRAAWCLRFGFGSRAYGSCTASRKSRKREVFADSCSSCSGFRPREPDGARAAPARSSRTRTAPGVPGVHATPPGRAQVRTAAAASASRPWPPRRSAERRGRRGGRARASRHVLAVDGGRFRRCAAPARSARPGQGARAGSAPRPRRRRRRRRRPRPRRPHRPPARRRPRRRGPRPRRERSRSASSRRAASRRAVLLGPGVLGGEMALAGATAACGSSSAARRRAAGVAVGDVLLAERARCPRSSTRAS